MFGCRWERMWENNREIMGEELIQNLIVGSTKETTKFVQEFK